MKVVVTGGTGMIGRKLISSLLATPELIDRDGNKSEVTSITAFDVMPPDPPLPDDDRLSVVTGEISDAEAIASLICDDTDAVFHLAAVVSAQAEEDFDLGMRVNLDGTRIVLERCRAWSMHRVSSTPVPLPHSAAKCPMSSTIRLRQTPRRPTVSPR